MWVEKFKGYLELRCEACGGELEGEMLQTVQGSNAPGIEVVPCKICIGELEDKINDLEMEDEEGVED